MIDFSFNLISNKIPSQLIREKKKVNSNSTAMNPKILTAKNKIPVIAVLMYKNGDKRNSSIIESSYVKWLISGGNDVIPIHFWMNKTEIKHVLLQSNSLIIPGFEKENNENEEFIKTTLNFALNLNQNKDHFPIMTIGEGSLVVQSLLAQDKNIIRNYNGVNSVMNEVEIIGEAKQIKMIMMFSKREYLAIKTRKSTAHFVTRAVSPEYYESNIKLNSKLKITGISRDINGKKYVSMFEGVNFPIFGFQFNPERIPWLRKTPGISYSTDSIEISQKFLNYFTLVSRLNKHSTVNVNASDIIDCGGKNGFISFNNEKFNFNHSSEINSKNSSHHLTVNPKSEEDKEKENKHMHQNNTIEHSDHHHHHNSTNSTNHNIPTQDTVINANHTQPYVNSTHHNNENQNKGNNTVSNHDSTVHSQKDTVYASKRVFNEINNEKLNSDSNFLVENFELTHNRINLLRRRHLY